MKGETREEIRNTIIYGTPAWRVIRLRQLLGDERKRVRGLGRELLPNYLSEGLRAIEAQVRARTDAAQQDVKADRLWNELRAKNKSNPPIGAVRFRPYSPNRWVEAACLWRELVLQIETALVVGDDDWLDELAKAIREGESLVEHLGDKFIAEVLYLFTKMPGATARDVFLKLHIEEMQRDGAWKVWDKKKKFSGKLRVEGQGHIFENKESVMKAIHKIEATVGHELKRKGARKRINNPLRHE